MKWQEGRRRRKRDVDKSTAEKNEKKKNEKRDYKVKYVGKAGRSDYERSAEHMSDFWNYEEGNHLLK